MEELTLQKDIPQLLTPSDTVISVQNTMKTNDDKLHVSTHGDVDMTWTLLEPGQIVKFAEPMYLLQRSWNQWVFPVIEVSGACDGGGSTPPPASTSSYAYYKAKDVIDIGDTYELIANLAVDRDAGVFELGVSFTYNFDRTGHSVYLRFSTDGGSTWNEFTSAHVNKTDATSGYYAFPHVHSADGVIQIRVEAKKDTSAGQFDINFLDVWIDQKV